MLKSLSIKNYAIIDNLSIDFDKGFNVFTGETGAGKSIIVGALSFLLKGRSDTSIIKAGKDKAIIEGVFDIKDIDIIDVLKEQDIEVDDYIIVKRVISSDGKNSIKINESSVTLSFLTDLFSKYVDIHSQKDNHFLFNRKNQLSLLDKYANNYDILNDYLSKYSSYQKINNELNELLNNTFNESEFDFYKFDYEELDKANLDTEEEKELELKESRFKSAEKYINSLSEAINIYDSNYGIKENLYNLFNVLNVNDSQVEDISNRIKSLYYELDEEVNKLKDIYNSFTDEDLNIEQIEDRLYTYSKLKRKHKTNVEGLIEIKNCLKQKLLLFEDRDSVINDKKKELAIAKDKLTEVSLKLHNSRIEAAKKLTKSITNEAKDLLLNNISFKIGFNDIDFSSTGKDEIEFMVSLNKGEDIKPLRHVASGGEISRLMLALKVVFANLSNTGLLILDEIDSGVSGKVALAIGEKIAKISNDLQVLCITHLAPVAACADNHFLIFKEDNSLSTTTNVRELNKNEIIEQLAIISNTSTDPKALAAAKELYTSCQKLVNENR